jgi:hypothetical protein
MPDMQSEPFKYTDLKQLDEFSPPGWGDLVPRFSFFLQATFCQPIKLVINGQMVAIGTSIVHKDTAWLACIIVHPKHRNKGLGRLITKELTDDLQQRKFQTIYLDATDMGYPVYQKLGFEVETEYGHLKPEKPLVPPTYPGTLFDFSKEYHPQILQLDEEISGEKREQTLLPHLQAAKLFLDNNQLQGFYLPTLDDGLIIATTTQAGIELMKCRLHHKAYAVLPVDNKPGIEFLKQTSLVQFRTSRRMRLGKPRKVLFEHIYNRISGQLG